MKTNKIILEIRPGEGGDDARLLVERQAQVYLRFCEHAGIAAEMIFAREGNVG